MNALERFDDHIVMRVFAPIAYWIDRKLWINNYRIGSYFAKLAALLTFLDPVFRYLWNGMLPQYLVIYFIVELMVAFIMYSGANEMRKDGEAYERNPTALPKNAVYYQSHQKLLYLAMGTMLFSTGVSLVISFVVYSHIVKAIAVFLYSSTWLVYSIGRYFAAVPPGPGKRDKKKITDISFDFANPLPAGVPS